MAGVNAYKDGVVARLFKGLTGLIKGRGITVIEGEGRLVGPTHGRGRRHARTTAAHVVLASGSYPSRCPASRSTASGCITSEHALRLDRVPALGRSCSAAA